MTTEKEYEEQNYLAFDPPNGWMYGFPKEVPNNINHKDDRELEAWILNTSGYPKKYITDALRYGRFIGNYNR